MTDLVASLGMYDHPGQHAANDAIWRDVAARLRQRGIAAPTTLDRTRRVEQIWRDPHLLFAQACGYPLVTAPDLRLQVVAAPIYDAPHCAGAKHRSLVLARADDTADDVPAFRGRVAAVNSPTSNTGYNLLRALIALHANDGRFFAGVIETGAHHASAEAVATGRADVAAVDAVTYAAWERHEPGLVAALRIVTVTPVAPSLPFVTALDTPADVVAALRTALAEALSDPHLTNARDALRLVGVTDASIENYAPVRAIAEKARAAGYPELA